MHKTAATVLAEILSKEAFAPELGMDVMPSLEGVGIADLLHRLRGAAAPVEDLAGGIADRASAAGHGLAGLLGANWGGTHIPENVAGHMPSPETADLISRGAAGAAGSAGTAALGGMLGRNIGKREATQDIMRAALEAQPQASSLAEKAMPWAIGGGLGLGGLYAANRMMQPAHKSREE